MLFNFTEIKETYKMNITGIIHVGAHLCEEAGEYEKNGISNVLWVEAIAELVNHQKHKRNIVQALIDEVDDKDVIFKISNNGESSSSLEMKTHLEQHPQVYVVQERRLKTIRMDTLLKKHQFHNYNFLNLDIQGKELCALKSFGNLDVIDYIYTEVNVEELYRDCCLMNNLDEYLVDFRRVDTRLTQHGWGDALYIRKGLPNLPRPEEEPPAGHYWGNIGIPEERFWAPLMGDDPIMKSI